MQRVALLKPDDLDDISSELIVALNTLIINNWNHKQNEAQFSRAAVEEETKRLYKKVTGENVEFKFPERALYLLRAAGWTVHAIPNDHIRVSK